MAEDQQDPDSSLLEGSGESLAARVEELARREPERLAEHLASLSTRAQAELALRLPARLRLELLLHAPRPMRLVRALPDSELYLTVRELGPADALPLLALSSASQLCHLLDLESWRRDRFDADRSGAWVALLLEAGEPTLKRLLDAADDDLLALLFQRWVRVEPYEPEDMREVHGHGQTEAGDERGLISPDGNYHFDPAVDEHAPAVQRIAQQFFQDQPERYRETLWSAVHEPPAELEERSLHWRQSRMEEHGFPPWEEALSVYAPPSGLRGRAAPAQPDGPEGLAAAQSPLRILPRHSPLGLAIDELEDASRDRVLQGLAYVANRLLVAEGADAGDPREHLAALDSALGSVSIALAARGAEEPGRARQLLEELPAIELFREGHARAVALRERARSLAGRGWAAAHPRAHDLLDSPLRERLAALLQPRPLYLELGDEGARPRGFRSLAEIEETRVVVELAELLGRIFVERLGLDVAGVLRGAELASSDPPRFATYLLTALAWHSTRGQLSIAPLPLEVAIDFLRDVASRSTAEPDALARALETLVRSVEQTLALTPRESALLVAFGRSCLERLAAECAPAGLAPEPDPRRLSCLLLE